MNEHPSAADMIADRALALAYLSERLAVENRTRCWHSDGRIENVAEHSHMLAVVAPALAEEFFFELDPGIVSRMCVIHDAVEAYVGDTATDIITEAGLEAKARREAKGLDMLKTEYAALPRFVKLVDDYELQQDANARFVRVVDKWMPLLLMAFGGAIQVRGEWEPGEWTANTLARADSLREEYPEWAVLLDVRDALTHRMAERWSL